MGVDGTRYNQDVTQDRNSYGRNLVTICCNNKVCIFNGRVDRDLRVGRPTTTHGTLVDYVIGSPTLLKDVNEFRVLDYDPLYSDIHCGIHVQLKVNIEYAIINNANIAPVSNYNQPSKWRASKEEDYIAEIDENQVKELIEQMDSMDIEDVSTRIKNILLGAAVKVFPPKKKKNYVKQSNNASLSGYDNICWYTRKAYHKARHKYNLRRSEDNKKDMIEKSKKYKAELKRVHNKEKENMLIKLKANRNKDPKTYWKILKENDGNKSKTTLTLADFHQHFKNLSEEISESDKHLSELESATIESGEEETLNEPITEHEVLKAIRKLKNDKAPGYDDIVNEYIKSTKNMLNLYVKFFNRILDTGYLPKEWLIGVIVPLYKNKGDVDDPHNYRGITLLSCLGKVFTSVLNDRLTSYSDSHNIIKENQAGFRQGYSTLDHIFLLKNIIDLFLWKKKQLFCLFIDYRKAFDTVWREGLWYKMVKENIGGKVLNVIRNMYLNIKSCVKFNGNKSDTFICNRGVRQGENLSPLLFALYVNDIEKSLIENRCNYLLFDDNYLDLQLNLLIMMYADDTVVLANSEEEMRNILNALELYCDKWKLEVNKNKTKIVVFSRGRLNYDNFHFVFSDEIIDTISEYKYLGVLFNYNGRFRNGQLDLKKRATRAMYSLIGKCRKHDLPVDLQLELFNTIVMPIMTYACEIWGYCIIREIKQLHMTFLKHVLHVHKYTSTDIVYGELGEYPIDIVINTRMIGYWSRLITGKTTKLSMIMYKSLLHLDSTGMYSSPWICHIRNILNNCGMSGIWMDQQTNNPEWLRKAVENKLKDHWITSWFRNISTKGLCKSYRMYKDLYCREDYLLKLKKSIRMPLIKIRTNNNRLPVVKGRYDSIDREERLCTLCRCNVVGDEYHILLSCPNDNIVELRNKYIPNYYRNNPTVNKFIQLMQSKSQYILSNISLFLKATYNFF
uniref:Reverse transcriptase domain-containing protein n=1 Tax=Scylla olivacea TaxID=85551 RepID=A0A0N7ZBB2_SCYOL